MKSEKRRNMRLDCARLMAGAIVATCLECLLGMAAPTVVSLLLGDMADTLLALDVAAIGARFPAFLGGILVTVLVAPGMTLVKNLLLTRQGTAYDMFLMGSTLGLPHKSLHQVDAGDYLHRFEVDRTLYYCCVERRQMGAHQTQEVDEDAAHRESKGDPAIARHALGLRPIRRHGNQISGRQPDTEIGNHTAHHGYC